MKILFWVVLFTQAGWWPKTDNAQDLRRVRIFYSSRSNSTTVYQVALARGIFKEEGLKVEMIQMNPRLSGLAVMKRRHRLHHDLAPHSAEPAVVGGLYQLNDARAAKQR
jgi:hypothetical protein